MAADFCYSPGLMPFEQARRLLLDSVNTINRIESINTRKAISRILAGPIMAPMDVPANDNSAMDGFAFAHQSLLNDRPLELVGEALAGHPYSTEILLGECVRITTGAVLPKGADTIEMKEKSVLENAYVRMTHNVSKGQFVRKKGEDVRAGTPIFEQGHKITAADIGLLSACGIDRVDVYDRIKVAVLSSGDELVEPGEPLKPGQLYDSNRHMLIAALSRSHSEVIDLGIARDTIHDTRQALEKACEDADLIISSGGVSVGEADLLKQVVDDIGTLSLWRIAVKPGKPFAFGTIGSASYVGLPGNPVSSLVTFAQLTLPILHKLQGLTAKPSTSLLAKLKFPITRQTGRKEFIRAKIAFDQQGQAWVEPTGAQGSGILSSMVAADGFIVVEPDIETIAANSYVCFEWFPEELQ